MIIGVDFGGTKIRAALVNNYRILKEITVLTQANKGRKKVLENLFEAIDYVFNSRVKSIGIGFDGVTDGKKIISASNVKALEGVKLKSLVEKKYSVPSYLENDVNAFVLAEYYYLKSKFKKRTINNVVGITVGTGFGGGIIINGRLYKGSHFDAGEIGHSTVGSDGRRCKCGNIDCLELYCSGNALERFYKELTNKKLSTYDIVRNYYSDKNAKKAVDKVAKYLGVGLVNIANFLDPDYIVVGGGLSDVKQILRQGIDYFKKHALKQAKKVRVIKSNLGKDSVVIGASLLSRHEKERSKR